MPSSEVQAEILSQGVSSTEPESTTIQPKGGKRPKFGPRPDFTDPEFDFKKELS